MVCHPDSERFTDIMSVAGLDIADDCDDDDVLDSCFPFVRLDEWPCCNDDLAQAACCPKKSNETKFVTDLGTVADELEIGDENDAVLAYSVSALTVHDVKDRFMNLLDITDVEEHVDAILDDSIDDCNFPWVRADEWVPSRTRCSPQSQKFGDRVNVRDLNSFKVVRKPWDAPHDDDDEPDEEETFAFRMPFARLTSWSLLGVDVWRSVELQRVVDKFNVNDLKAMNISFSIADPRQADCPLVTCSSGFAHLTGYMLEEIVGRNCRFLLKDVAPQDVDEQARNHAREFCIGASKGELFESRSDMMSLAKKIQGCAVPKGELACIQMNATKTATPFKNMFYLKQVCLDDAPYIVAMQVEVPEKYEDPEALQELQAKFQFVWQKVGNNMKLIEQVLSRRNLANELD